MYGLVLVCSVLAAQGFTLPPLELSLTLRLRDVERDMPARCIQKSVTPVDCTNVNNTDALVAHPDDCQLFYYCETGRATPTCRQCPANLHFNPTLHVCDWPQNAGCTAQDLTTPSTTPDPSINTTEPSNVTWPWDPTTNTPNTTDESLSNSTSTTPQWNATTVPQANATVTDLWTTPWNWSNNSTAVQSDSTGSDNQTTSYYATDNGTTPYDWTTATAPPSWYSTTNTPGPSEITAVPSNRTSTARPLTTIGWRRLN